MRPPTARWAAPTSPCLGRGLGNANPPERLSPSVFIRRELREEVKMWASPPGFEGKTPEAKEKRESSRRKTDSYTFEEVQLFSCTC